MSIGAQKQLKIFVSNYPNKFQYFAKRYQLGKEYQMGSKGQSYQASTIINYDSRVII